MRTDKPIVSGSGIRGIFGVSLTVDTAMRYATAFGKLCGCGKIVIGRDTRVSGPAVTAAVSAGLMSVGCDVVQLGIVPTPTVQLEAMKPGIAGGIAVTSSHNSGEWNALKLIGADGVFLRSGARNKFLKVFESGCDYVDYTEVGTEEIKTDAIEEHIRKLMTLPWVVQSGRKIKAVIDATGGTAAEFAPKVLDVLGVNYEIINTEMLPGGNFPRVAEPAAENLTELSAAVVEHGADVGFAFDPDGDRLALVDDRGRIIGEDYTIALALDFILRERPGPAVVNLSTSRLAEDAAARRRCRLYRSPVGEVNVVEEMERCGSDIGGEGNGGVIDFKCHAGRDSGVGMACVISLLRDEPELTLGDWADSYPDYVMFKHKEALPVGFETIRDEFLASYGSPDDERDGLWYKRENGWTHIRPSGTEPVIRFISENTENVIIERDFRIFRKIMEKICVE